MKIRVARPVENGYHLVCDGSVTVFFDSYEVDSNLVVGAVWLVRDDMPVGLIGESERESFLAEIAKL